MNFGLNFAAACGLAAFVAFTAPASANTYTYDLAGDTTKAYTDPAEPGFTYVDLVDANDGTTTSFPPFSLHVNDTIQVTVTLNNPASFNYLDIFLQEVSDKSTIMYDQTVLFSLGGATVPNPSTGFWNGIAGSRGGLGFSPGYYPDPGSLTFDKVIVTAVVTSLTDPLGGAVSSLELLAAPTSIGFFNPAVAATPLPGAWLLMTTALCGLGFFARRKRAASAEA